MSEHKERFEKSPYHNLSNLREEEVVTESAKQLGEMTAEDGEWKALTTIGATQQPETGRVGGPRCPKCGHTDIRICCGEIADDFSIYCEKCNYAVSDVADFAQFFSAPLSAKLPGVEELARKMFEISGANRIWDEAGISTQGIWRSDATRALAALAALSPGATTEEGE